MSKLKKPLYVLAVLIPVILGYIIWDVKGDIFELTGNMRIAQYLDRENELVFPQDVLFVENHIRTKYLDKYADDGQTVLVFGQRNPDLPRYSIFFKILGEHPDAMKNLYEQIVSDFKSQGAPVIESVKENRRNELNSLKIYIETIESAKSKPPQNLRDGESYMQISKQLTDLKQRKEFLEISLNSNNLFNYYSLNEATLKKKRDKSLFVFSLLIGVLFLSAFLSYLVWRVI